MVEVKRTMVVVGSTNDLMVIAIVCWWLDIGKSLTFFFISNQFDDESHWHKETGPIRFVEGGGTLYNLELDTELRRMVLDVYRYGYCVVKTKEQEKALAKLRKVEETVQKAIKTAFSYLTRDYCHWNYTKIQREEDLTNLVAKYYSSYIQCHCKLTLQFIRKQVLVFNAKLYETRTWTF